MLETRHQFREDLKELERQTLGGIDLVVGQLDRALESVSDLDVELAGLVVAEDQPIDRRYRLRRLRAHYWQQPSSRAGLPIRSTVSRICLSFGVW